MRTDVALFALALAAGCSRGPTYEGPYRNVVVITLDTLRADHLGCYGGAATSTPNLDRIAAGGVRFGNVTTAAPTTLASHTSIMTGTYPHTHGVPRNAFKVSDENVMLAEVLQQQGFKTAAFLGSWALDSRFGFAQGFEVYDESFEIESVGIEFDQDQRRAEAVTDAVLRHVDSTDAERRFLFVHYFDAHSPFDPPAPFAPDGLEGHGGLPEIKRAVHQHQARFMELGSFEETDPSRFDLTILNAIPRPVREQADGVELPIDRELQALYAGEVRYLDHHVGRLFDGLRERGLLEETLVVIVADHGESFHEHADYWNHGLWVYETTARVPWILWRSPGLREGGEAGRVVDVPVSTIDIVPTLLELLGLEPLERVEGVSTVPAVRGGSFERGPVYCEATQPLHPKAEEGGWRNRRKPRSVRMARWKLIEAPLHRSYELYDLDEDPGERRNLLEDPELGGRAEELRTALEAWSAMGNPLPSSFLPDQQENMRSRSMWIRRMQDAGYVGESSDDDGELEGAENGEGNEGR